MYHSLPTLQSYDHIAALHTHNSVLSHFLQGITDTNITTSPQTKLLSLSYAMHQIHHTRCLTFTSPLCFSNNLVLYFLTKSKKAVNLWGSLGPYGSYTTLMKWLSRQSMQPLQRPVDGDVITFFDNNQVVGKTHRVKVQQKVPISVITTSIHIKVFESQFRR